MLRSCLCQHLCECISLPLRAMSTRGGDDARTFAWRRNCSRCCSTCAGKENCDISRWPNGNAEWFMLMVARIRNSCHARQLRIAGGQLGWQQWWPVIFVQVDATRVVAFCQDQALTLSRPWLTYIDRVVCCRGASQQLLDARGRAHVVPAHLSAPPAKHPADLAAVSTVYDPVHSTTVII